MSEDLRLIKVSGCGQDNLENINMKKTIVAASFIALTSMAGFTTLAHAAAAVPCEDMLKTLTEAMATAKLKPADLKSVNDLKAKAEERCTAEDDKRSDGFVADAMKVMGK